MKPISKMISYIMALDAIKFQISLVAYMFFRVSGSVVPELSVPAVAGSEISSGSSSPCTSATRSPAASRVLLVQVRTQVQTACIVSHC